MYAKTFKLINGKMVEVRSDFNDYLIQVRKEKKARIRKRLKKLF